MMLESVVVAIDAMGGDYGLATTLPAAVLALKAHPELSLILVGDEEVLRGDLKLLNITEDPRLTIRHAPEVVTMDEAPSHAFRNKKHSSMRLAINLVHTKEAHACVSAGNTGALMMTSKFVLKTLPGIDRPAIIGELPSVRGKSCILDLGANVDSCAEHLVQFALMGSILIQVLDNIARPTVGLLNIGVEEIKGNDQVKRTAHLLANNKNINYVGYVEGDAIYNGTVDLVVCDGFVGNIALKASEGLAKLIQQFIREAFEKNLWTRCAGFLTQPILRSIKKRIQPEYYNGASLLGLNGIVIKSHGAANALGFKHAIDKAIFEVRGQVLERIHSQVAALLNEGVIS